MKLNCIIFHKTVIFTVKTTRILNLYFYGHEQRVGDLVALDVHTSAALAIGRLRLPFIMV